MAEGSITTTVEVMGEEEEGVSTTTDLRPLSVGVPRPTPRPPTDRPLPPSGAATTATGAATDAGRTPGRDLLQKDRKKSLVFVSWTTEIVTRSNFG